MSLTMSELARIEDQHDENYVELRRLVDAEEFTNILDMLAEIALERIDVRKKTSENEHMEKIALLIRGCATAVEHRT